MLFRSFIGIGMGATALSYALEIKRASNNLISATNTAASSSTAGAGIQYFHDDGAAMASGDRLAFNVYSGATNTSSGVGSGAAVTSFTTEAWSASANGCDLRFETTRNTTSSRVVALKIDQNQQVLVSGFAAATTGFVVKAASSQTATIAEWQNSSATVMASIGPTGAFLVNPTSASVVGATIKLAASATADAQKWQDYNANDLARVDVNGTVYTGGVGQSSLSKGLIVNSGAGNASTDDLQVKGTTDANLLYVDVSADSIGIGTASPTAYLHLKAATTTAATLRIPSGTAPTSPNEGDYWFDSTQKTMMWYGNGIKRPFTGVLFTQTATGTVANTVTETSMDSTGVGSKTLPANFFVAGKKLRIVGYGIHSASGSPTLRIKVKLGSTVVLDTTAIATKNSTNEVFHMMAEITCRTTGASGTLFAQGVYDEVGFAGFQMVNTTTTTIDTTASQAITVTATWGTASASNTISMTNFSVEVLN